MSWHGNNQPALFLNNVNGTSFSNNGHFDSAVSNVPHISAAPSNASQLGNALARELGNDHDQRLAAFQELYVQSEARIGALFGEKTFGLHGEDANEGGINAAQNGPTDTGGDEAAAVPARKPARTIDDDYDDYADDDDDDDDGAESSPLKTKSTHHLALMTESTATKPPTLQLPTGQAGNEGPSSQEQSKTSEDVRKKLEEDKKAAEDAAKRSFHTLFYTLENDRDAMLEQRKLEESDRQVDAEMSGNGNHGPNHSNTSAGNNQHGTLSSANLGASSLTLKHLIARIDAKRDQVRASDAQLRSLMTEVRKNRSKWASEEKIGQEELYEAAEKVLSELKAMTEHSTAFLGRVNKREAPDYYNVIKHPMDLGSMTKKLKAVQYKSKEDFVYDLNLIWANCLRYNANPEHFLRKHALYMKKETEKLVPLIPDIVIKDRAEVEAEERRLHSADGDIDGGEESDDEPIMSSRGRTAPGKTSKKGATTARKAPIANNEGTPIPESKPLLAVNASSGSMSHLKNDFLKLDSDTAMEGSQNGFSTPPLGTLTPAINGASSSVPPGSQADAMEIDGFGSSVNGVTLGQSLTGLDIEVEHDSTEYKTWKQVTKKDRAYIASERNRLFKGDHLNPDEPALLRTKAGMRRWLRKQRQADVEGAAGEQNAGPTVKEGEDAAASGETLAEGMEGEEETVLPDYYDTVAAIPELSHRLQWVEDAEGQVIDPSEEFLRMVPKGYFTSRDSVLTRKMEANMRQMQETRKVCTKIGVVKQMQLQSQMYQNQFQKYNPEPFVEADIGAHVISDEGPVMAPWVCRAALQRSVGKIFYHAGFEEFQPSALDAVTDIAGDFFTKLVRTLGVYRDAPKMEAEALSVDDRGVTNTLTSKFTSEETILHCLHENGLDVEALESYVKDDVERLSTKLGVVHDRMKSHLADLLRPALNDAGPDGSNAFVDGSEQFVGGDFAEDLDEDFFGFKELGLDKEFGLASLSVPLHLLQNRMHNAYQAQNTNATSTSASAFEPPPPYEAVTIHNVKSQIGLVQNFFLAKLHANNDEPLIEDDDLPQKQRFPKPRLPPTGKISSPRKRPLKEQGGNAKKKKKVGEGPEDGMAKALGKPVGKLKLSLPPGPVPMERVDSGKASEPDKEDSSAVGGMMSPESLEAT